MNSMMILCRLIFKFHLLIYGFSNQSESSKYTTERDVNLNKSDRALKANMVSGAQSLMSDSRNNNSESEKDYKRDKILGILEDQQSGNPFENRDDPYENMYYAESDSKPHSNSLNQSIRSKKEKIKSTFPDVLKKDVSSKRSHDGNSSTLRRHKNVSRKLSMKSSNNSEDRESYRKELNSSFQSKSKQMASFDAGPSKMIDRNFAKSSNDPKNTIMTAHHPAYRNGLDVDASNRELVSKS